MDEKVRQLLAQMPERPPRSKLEPHSEVIRELRRKRRTYLEISAFFREHLQLSVAPSTLHDFVKIRSRRPRESQAMTELPPLPTETSVPDISVKRDPPAAAADGAGFAAKDNVREHIRAVKNQSDTPAQPGRPVFTFDADQPLALNPKKEK